MPCTHGPLMKSSMALFVLIFVSSAHGEAELDDLWGGWTGRLGLSFTDDCQEHAGVFAVWAWAESWFSGRRGKQRNAHCETKQLSCARVSPQSDTNNRAPYGLWSISAACAKP